MDNIWNIREIILKNPDLQVRLDKYAEIINKFQEEDKSKKDNFLLSLVNEEQKREIARFVYLQSGLYSEAHYEAIYFLLNNLLLEKEPAPKIKPPNLIFNETHDIIIYFPPQRLSKKYSNAEIILEINGLESGPDQIELEKFLEHNFVITNSFKANLLCIQDIYTIQLSTNKAVLETWKIENISESRPFFAFNESSGCLINSETLPRKRTWIVTEGSILELEGRREGERLKGTWASFNYYLLNPNAKIDFYLTLINGNKYKLPFEEPERIVELLGTPIDGILLDSPIPWYTVVPKLSIPYESFEDVTTTSTVKIYQKMDKNFVLLKNFMLDNQCDYIENEKDSRRIIVDLSDDAVLGPTPLGEYKINIIVAGFETELLFTIVPQLEVKFMPSIICHNANQGTTLDVSIRGPTKIECNSPDWNEIRSGFFRIKRDELPNELHGKIQFNLFYDSGTQNNGSSILLDLIIPSITFSIGDKSIQNTLKKTSGGFQVLKSSLENSIETAKIDIHKSINLPGYWRIKIGDQYGERFDGWNEETISFPLTLFSDTISDRYSDPTPLELEYVYKGEITLITLLSVIDWNIHGLEIKIDEIENFYQVIVSWKDRGREKPAYLQIYDEKSLKPIDGVMVTPESIPTSGYEFVELEGELLVPSTTPVGNYTLGFSYEKESGEWTFIQKLEHRYPISLKRDEYELALWYFNRGKYRESQSRIENVASDHQKYANALHLKAKIIGLIAEELSDTEERRKSFLSAIEILNEAIHLQNDNPEFLLEHAHLMNRRAYYENNKKECYKKSLPLLVSVLKQTPQDLHAITEQGISLMGTGITVDGMRIYQYLEFLDPDHKDPYSLWGRANLLYQYCNLVKKAISKKNYTLMKTLITMALKIDSQNPLYLSFFRDITNGLDSQKTVEEGGI